MIAVITVALALGSPPSPSSHPSLSATRSADDASPIRDTSANGIAPSLEPDLSGLSPRQLIARADELVETESAETALDLYRRADLESREPGVRATARFNLARAIYAAAAPEDATIESLAMSEDFDATVETLHAAARAFRSTLEVSPTDRAAVIEVERVRRLIHAISQKRKELEEQAQQMQELADRLDQLADRQQREAEQNQTPQGQPAEQSAEQARSDQLALNQETQELMEQLEQTQQPGERSPGEQVRDAQRRQEQASESLEQGDQQSASQRQRDAAQRLREAADQARRQADQTRPRESRADPSDEQDSQQQGDRPGDSEPPLGEQDQASESETPLERAVRNLLEREERQRERRDRARRAIRTTPVTVERDW